MSVIFLMAVISVMFLMAVMSVMFLMAVVNLTIPEVKSKGEPPLSNSRDILFSDVDNDTEAKSLLEFLIENLEKLHNLK